MTKKQKKSSKKIIQQEEVEEDIYMSDDDDDDDDDDVDDEEEEQYQEEEESEEDVDEQKLTLEVLDAISDEEGDDDDENMEWDAEALALRQAIAEGAFDNIGKNLSKKVKKKVGMETEEVSYETNDNDLEEEEEEEEEDNEKESDEQDVNTNNKTNTKALQTVTLELTTAKAKLPWAERYDVTPPTLLPFGKKDEDGNVIQVHDDLKREVAFYNLALEAVHVGRKKCEEVKIPFSRPEDFFAEMVKTDDHMAKVKDRLIFESKKMDAFEQRKSNVEQKLRAKEAHAHRLSEKAKSKKRHMQDVDDWAKSVASKRIGNQIVHDDDDEYLSRMNGNGPNKKRIAMNKKYGYGGKRGRFKQNDKKSINDMSGYNPKGNFSGGKKAGAKRKGKRARDAAKAKR